MLLATYRSDELDRRHPLTRTVQTWRRAGLAETVTVSAMTQRNVAEMIAAILNADDVSAELANLVDARAEGNPFVLEEMLREALDRGEIIQTDGRLGARLGRGVPLAGDRARGGAASSRPARRRADRGAAGGRRPRPHVRLRLARGRRGGSTRRSCSQRSSPPSRSSFSTRARRRATATAGATRSPRRRSRPTRSCRSASGSTRVQPMRSSPDGRKCRRRRPPPPRSRPERRGRRRLSPRRRRSRARGRVQRGRPSSSSASSPTSPIRASARCCSLGWAICAG